MNVIFEPFNLTTLMVSVGPCMKNKFIFLYILSCMSYITLLFIVLSSFKTNNFLFFNFIFTKRNVLVKGETYCFSCFQPFLIRCIRV